MGSRKGLHPAAALMFAKRGGGGGQLAAAWTLGVVGGLVGWWWWVRFRVARTTYHLTSEHDTLEGERDVIVSEGSWGG
jgi:hypothetical protein